MIYFENYTRMVQLDCVSWASCCYTSAVVLSAAQLDKQEGKLSLG